VEPGGDKGHNHRGTVAVEKSVSWIPLTVLIPLPLLATSQTHRDYPSRRRLHSRPRRHPRLNAVERGNFEGRDWSGRRSGRKLRVGYPTLRAKDTVGLRSTKSALHGQCICTTFMLFTVSTSIVRNANESLLLWGSCGPPWSGTVSVRSTTSLPVEIPRIGGHRKSREVLFTATAYRNHTTVLDLTFVFYIVSFFISYFHLASFRSTQCLWA
jgi:hypothetical protein